MPKVNVFSIRGPYKVTEAPLVQSTCILYAGGYYTKTSKLTYDFEKEKVWVCIVLWLQQTYNKMKKKYPILLRVLER